MGAIVHGVRQQQLVTLDSALDPTAVSASNPIAVDEAAKPSELYLEFTGVIGVNDNDVVYTSPDVSMYNYHLIEATAGTIDVDVSADGTNWIAAVAFVSVVTTTPATRVVDAAAGVMVQLTGKFKKIRINQKGAVASNARGAHGVI